MEGFRIQTALLSHQGIDFRWQQAATRAGRQLSQTNRANGDAVQTGYLIAQSFQHPPDLTVIASR
jgi:hypothetical protein